MIAVGSGYDFTGIFEDIFIFPDNKNLQKPVASHPDMNMCIIDDNVFLPKNSPIKEILESLDFTTIEIDEDLKPNYPFDVPLNCVASGENVILNEKTVASKILNYCKEQGKNIINVNQGYAHCTVLAIADNAFITSDRGTAKALKAKKLDVLEISQGGIILNGYDYGFIGGCSGFVDDVLYFCGDIKSHPDYIEIDKFLNKYGVRYKCLVGKLTDVGGIIELKEKDIFYDV